MSATDPATGRVPASAASVCMCGAAFRGPPRSSSPRLAAPHLPASPVRPAMDRGRPQGDRLGMGQEAAESPRRQLNVFV